MNVENFEHGDLQEYRILDGFYRMHDSGFSTHDLEPSNVLIKIIKGHEEGRLVKICDFSVSKRAEDGMTALRTMAGTVFLPQKFL